RQRALGARAWSEGGQSGGGKHRSGVRGQRAASSQAHDRSGPHALRAKMQTAASTGDAGPPLGGAGAGRHTGSAGSAEHRAGSGSDSRQAAVEADADTAPANARTRDESAVMTIRDVVR